MNSVLVKLMANAGCLRTTSAGIALVVFAIGKQFGVTVFGIDFSQIDIGMSPQAAFVAGMAAIGVKV